MSSKFLSIFLSLLVVVSLWVPLPAQADIAPKNTTNSGPYAPGDEVPIEIQVTKPTTPPSSVDPIEVVVVMDLSGSIGSEVNTARTALKKFADDLAPYYGMVSIGLRSFGQGYGSFGPSVITAASASSFKAAIDNMYIGCPGCAYSDIVKGMQDGNALFTNSTAKKYMFLLTDGYANTPPNPVNPGTGLRSSGNCPVIVNGTATAPSATLGPAITLKSSTFRILPLKIGTDYTRTLNTSTTGPCGGTTAQVGRNAYVSWGFNHNIPLIESVCRPGEGGRGWATLACDLLDDMADWPRRVYPNSALVSSISPDLNSIIDEATLLKQVQTIQLNDVLNSNVFDIAKGIDNIAVYRCGTNTPIGTIALTAVGLTISGNITNLGSETNFCVRFTATVKDSPTTGSTTINTINNSINHRNNNGTIIRTDTIAPGSIVITDPTPNPNFNTEAPQGTIVQPGSAAAIQNINLTYLPDLATWGNGQLTTSVVAILSGTNNCSAYTNASPAVSSGSDINLHIPHDGATGGSYTFPASSRNQVSLELTTSAATQGTYTLCIASRSAVGTANNPIVARTFEVRYASWLQVGATSASRHSGDIHSNGGITFSIPPTQYFFSSGLAGLVSSSSSTASALSITSGRLSSLVEWRIGAYNQTINSPIYAKLLETATNNAGAPEVRPATPAGSGQPHTMAQCAAGQTKAFRIAGHLTRGSLTSLTNANCPSASTIYFVDGNLTVSQNIIDDTNASSITFIVQGDIIVQPNVTRLDGMYIFAGSFSNGVGDQAITTKGSLIGLGGKNPSNATGRFHTGSASGFQRDLGTGNNNPAESIIYQPKYLHLVNSLLGGSSLSWQEN